MVTIKTREFNGFHRLRSGFAAMEKAVNMGCDGGKCKDQKIAIKVSKSLQS